MGGVDNFAMAICLKVNVIEQVEFQIGYFQFSMQLFSHFATRNPLSDVVSCNTHDSQLFTLF